MATIERVETTCDKHPDGFHTPDDQVVTVTFGIDGADYETDLCVDEADKLHEVLNRHASAGRRKHKKLPTTTGESQRGGKSQQIKANREKLAEIRRWARAAGQEVSDRGRVAHEIVEAFEKAKSLGHTQDAQPEAAAPADSAPPEHPHGVGDHHQHHDVRIPVFAAPA